MTKTKCLARYANLIEETKPVSKFHREGNQATHVLAKFDLNLATEKGVN